MSTPLPLPQSLLRDVMSASDAGTAAPGLAAGGAVSADADNRFTVTENGAKYVDWSFPIKPPWFQLIYIRS
jgi:hypothetical protein